jgi:UDP-N-acetylglucosamine--N-acetylmuramyl-(pentapeptide) pyrophosphoryl-undecaprenol N-acetylglucosamine transferase
MLWIGGIGGMEADLVKRAGIPFTAISAAGLHGVGIWAMPGNFYRLAKGVIAARNILLQFKPDVIFYTGGYVAIPVAFASQFTWINGKRPASLLYVPDIEPGLALQVLARVADQVAVTAEDARQYFPRRTKITVTGYPVRNDLVNVDSGESSAVQVLNLSADLPVLLVFGGSKGARSINQALVTILPELLNEMQIIHITGTLDWPLIEETKSKIQPDLAENYHAYPYLHDEMAAALASADLVVSRAGAATLGEFPQFGLPAILVPYPHAWRYQQVNGQYLEKRGAAIIIHDKDLPLKLLPVIRELMQDRSRREAMANAMRVLAHPDASEKIGELLTSLVVSPNQERN